MDDSEGRVCITYKVSTVFRSIDQSGEFTVYKMIFHYCFSLIDLEAVVMSNINHDAAQNLLAQALPTMLRRICLVYANGECQRKKLTSHYSS